MEYGEYWRDDGQIMGDGKKRKGSDEHGDLVDYLRGKE